MLREAERNGEIALHAARALYIALIVSGFSAALRPPALPLALGIGFLVAFWIAALRGLRSDRTFTPTRYMLVVFDLWLVMDAVLYARIDVLRELAAAQGVAAAAIPTEFFDALVPPLLVLIALSSAFRFDPRPAILTAVLAMGAYLYYMSESGLSPEVALPVGLLVAFAGILGVNAARAIRYLLLKSQEAAVLETYVPQSLSRDLHEQGLERSGRVEDVTLLVSDIRGFTRISESLSPADTVKLVNDYLEAVSPPIVNAGGVIDKYMGDGVLAFFQGDGNESRALSAARQVLEAGQRVRFGDTPLRLGIALHSGPVLVGTVGPRVRRQYTIISDAVNTVSRLEELNKAYASRIVVSNATMERVDQVDRAGFDGPFEVTLRGRDAPVRVYRY